MSESDPLASLPCEAVPLAHFIARDIGDPDEADAAELSRLIAVSTRPANEAFLSALTPKDRDAAAESQALAGGAAEGAAALPDDTTLTSADITEAHALAAFASRPRTRGLMRLTAGRLAAAEIRERNGANTPVAAKSVPAAPLAAPPAATPDSTPAVASAPAPADVALTPASAADDGAADGTEDGSGLPRPDSTVVLVALPGLAPAAHDLASLLTDGAEALRDLPEPFDDGECAVYPWLVRTRYFVATVWVLVVALGESGDHLPLKQQLRALTQLAEVAAHAARCGAMVLLYDAVAPQGWQTMTRLWERAFAEQVADTELDVAVAMGLGGDGAGSGGGDDDDATAAALEWCVDRRLEMIVAPQAELARGSAAWEQAAAVARGDRAAARRYDADADGLPRLCEALQCRVWPAHHPGGQPSDAYRAAHGAQVQALRARLAALRPPQLPPAARVGGRGGGRAPAPAADAVAGLSTVVSAGGGRAAVAAAAPMWPPAAAPTAAAREAPVNAAEAEAKAGARLMALAGEDAVVSEEAMNSEERQHESYERLLEEMSKLRQTGDALPEAERRQRAEAAALQMAQMLGDDDDDDDEDEDDDES